MTDTSLNARWAAPCGLYCGLCDQDECRGCGCDCRRCAGHDRRTACAIAQCVEQHKISDCSTCPDFACTKLIQFTNDPIWRTHLPVIENLRRRKAIGNEKWLQEQKEYWSDAKNLQKWTALAAECEQKANDLKGRH
jgi:hypothetical protein